MFCRVHNIKIGDQPHPRKFINTNQFHIHERRESHLDTLRRLESEFNDY